MFTPGVFTNFLNSVYKFQWPWLGESEYNGYKRDNKLYSKFGHKRPTPLESYPTYVSKFIIIYIYIYIYICKKVLEAKERNIKDVSENTFSLNSIIAPWAMKIG